MIFPKPGRQTGVFSGPMARASVIGLHLVSGIITGVLIGYGLDKWLETRFWFWIFLVLGIVAGFLNMYRDAKRMMREQDEHDAATRTRKM